MVSKENTLIIFYPRATYHPHKKKRLTSAKRYICRNKFSPPEMKPRKKRTISNLSHIENNYTKTIYELRNCRVNTKFIHETPGDSDRNLHLFFL